jgi:hypothetical protein
VGSAWPPGATALQTPTPIPLPPLTGRNSSSLING